MSEVKRPSMQLASRLDWFTTDIKLVNSEDWDFVKADTQYLLHNLHGYPARFIPQIPKRAIERWSKPGETVLDPFCGSGTTLLECGLSGRNSIGVDNNAVATLLARAKVAAYNEDDLMELRLFVDYIVRSMKEISSLREEDIKNWIPAYRSINRWFDSKAILELAWIKNKIDTLKEPKRLLALAVFSSIILSSSMQDSDTRYAIIYRSYESGYASRKWISRMMHVIDRAMQTIQLIKSSTHGVYTEDSRHLPFIKDNSIDLIVTSPPYLNAYDYHKYHRHRLHWIDGDVELARNTELGKHDTFTRPNADPQRYFNDIKFCLEEWKRILEPKARVFVVIGDAIVGKKFVPVGDKFAETANDVGFQLEDRWMRNLTISQKSFNMSARIKREHLLLFRKKD